MASELIDAALEANHFSSTLIDKAVIDDGEELRK